MEGQQKCKNVEDEMKLNAEHLLYSSLSLLGYDFQEQSKLLNVKIGPGTFNEESPKVFYSILKFLLCKLIGEQSSSETIDLLLYYPPRNSKDILNFKIEAYKLLQSLQKRHLLPQSLFLSKIVLDVVGGKRCVQFLRNLAEFTLRNEFIQQFPSEQMSVFNFNKKNEKKSDHQVHQIDELYPSLSILSPEREPQATIEEVNTQTKIVQAHLEVEYDSIQKKMKKYHQNTNEVSSIAEVLNRKYQDQRQLNINLREYLKERHDVPEKLLSDLRKLDRMPQIDLIKETILELQQIDEQIQKNDFKNRSQQFLKEFLVSDSSNVINRNLLHAEVDQDAGSGVIKVEDYFGSFRNSLKAADRSIQNLKTEQFITFQQSLMDKLNLLSQSSNELTNQLISLKQLDDIQTEND